MEYADAVRPTDEVVEDKGVKILIDPKAVLFLLGTEMDYKVDKLSAQFVFNNPNQTSACGCGESVQLTPAKDAALSLRGGAEDPTYRELFRLRPGRSAACSAARAFADGLMIALVDGVIYLKADDHVPTSSAKLRRSLCTRRQAALTSYWRCRSGSTTIRRAAHGRGARGGAQGGSKRGVRRSHEEARGQRPARRRRR